LSASGRLLGLVPRVGRCWLSLLLLLLLLLLLPPPARCGR